MDTELKTNYLMRTAQKYIWWKSPEDSVKYPQMVLARVMNMGIWEDICELPQIFTQEELHKVLHDAEAGQFNDRSWHFWHYRLTDCALGKVPELPARRRSQ